MPTRRESMENVSVQESPNSATSSKQSNPLLSSPLPHTPATAAQKPTSLGKLFPPLEPPQ
ncbi:hypothetical protein BGX38DRAFT_1163386 [Terfezia claveryi]|nr:hypothetical protein BGX38DRAFT_1163386 [Terfezia claveryi]